MSFEEMISVLRRKGVPESLLPSRENGEGCYTLRSERENLVVSQMERGKSDDIALFPSEASAVAFIHEMCVIAFAIDGDERIARWNANRTQFPLPRAEDFGGRSLLQ